MGFVKSLFFLLLLAAFAVSASGVYAHLEPIHQPKSKIRKERSQQQQTPEERVEKKLEWMRKELRLTDSQATKIKVILIEKQSFRIDRESLKHATPEAKKDTLERLLQQRKEAHERIIALLTPDQQKIYQSLLKTKERGGHRFDTLPKR